MNLYALGWFHVKSHSSVSDGATNFWFILKSSKTIKPCYQASVLKVLERNAFLAHPESILLSMLVDEDQSVRDKAVNLIANKSLLQERNFVLPKLKAGAPTYHKMIDWNKEEVTFPPLLQTESTARKAIKKPLRLDDFPCQSQGIERVVSAVTQAADTQIGYERRHRTIVNRMKSRMILPVFESKQDWN